VIIIIIRRRRRIIIIMVRGRISHDRKNIKNIAHNVER